MTNQSDHPTCKDCGKPGPLNGRGNCAECQAMYDRMAGEFISDSVTLDELVGKVSAAEDIDQLFAVFARALPPGDKVEQQHWREALMRAMHGKVSSPSKIVDAWLGSGDGGEAVAIALKQSAELVQIVLSQNAKMFHTRDRQSYASVDVSGHREVMSVRSRAFRQWLARLYWEHTATPINPHEGLLAAFGASVQRVPAAQAVNDAIATLEGLAVFDGDELDVHVRVAHFGNKVYLDLGNEQWEAVEIDDKGWRVVTRPPVMFRRPPGLEALPAPQNGGEVKALAEFLNCSDDDWPLVAGYVVALLSQGPYPVLVFLGEQGCGKSTSARVIRRIIDPNSSALRRKPRSDHDLAITANNSWVLSFDNLSSMPVWLSDALCTVATGGGFATRMLYTDDEERIFDSMRPTIINGIGDVVARSDLLDRAVLVNLPRIETVRSEEKFWKDFEAALPKILGAVLTATSKALTRLAGVELEETPRMVDFARWVTAAEPALGLTDGQFLKAYIKNRALADQTALETSPIGRFIVAIAEDGQWIGTAAELINKLNVMANTADKVIDTDREGPTRRQEGWPKAANALSKKLKQLAPNLRRVGVEITITRNESGSQITISKKTKPTTEGDSS